MIEHLKEKLNDYYLSLQSQILNKQSYYENLLKSDDEYVALNNELGVLNLEIAKLKYNDIDCTELEKQADILNRKIAKICDKFKKYSKISYKCNKCLDTGIYNGKQCKCYKQNLTNLIFKELNVTKPQQINIQNVVAPKGLESVYEKMFLYAKKFPNTKFSNIVIGGKTGAGKTYLANLISQIIESRGYTTIFLTSTDLNNIFIKMHVNDSEKFVYFDILSNADFLVIDDIGTEPIYNNITLEYLNSLITARLTKNKPFLITTNLSPIEIKERYTERFFSRIYDKSKSIYFEFNTKDLRI